VTAHPFRFWTGQGDERDSTSLIGRARKAEAYGFDAMVVSDHLLDELAPIAFLSYVAAVTDRLRVGTFVFNNDLRHPIVLAQELASIDRLSRGRLIVGIGAGWNEPEYRQAGIPFGRTEVRLERLEESVAVLKAVFAGGVNFRGKYYTVEGFEDFIRPQQQPHPPLLIGGGGQRGLTLAARQADIVGLAPRIEGRLQSVSAEATDQKLEWIRTAAGNRFDELEINTYAALRDSARVTDRGRAALEEISDRIRAASRGEMTPDDLDASPHVLVGSVGHLVEKILAMRDRWGINVVTLGEPEEFAPVVERLAGR
jgi:probable F420-dependent oxidoreductase